MQQGLTFPEQTQLWWCVCVCVSSFHIGSGVRTRIQPPRREVGEEKAEGDREGEKRDDYEILARQIG